MASSGDDENDLNDEKSSDAPVPRDDERTEDIKRKSKSLKRTALFAQIFTGLLALGMGIAIIVVALR